MKFEKDSPELEMLNGMVKRDLDLLKKELYPEIEESTKIKMVDGIGKYLLLVEHSARHDLYQELGADVLEYKNFIKEEMKKMRKG